MPYFLPRDVVDRYVGARVYFEILRGDSSEPPYARGVLIVIEGSKPPAVEQWEASFAERKAGGLGTNELD
ncbi:hypothetical protein ACVSQB_32990 [Bradyrhizobium elkanii]